MGIFRSKEDKFRAEKLEQDRKDAGFSYHYIGKWGECYICDICSSYVCNPEKHRLACAPSATSSGQ